MRPSAIALAVVAALAGYLRGRMDAPAPETAVVAPVHEPSSCVVVASPCAPAPTAAEPPVPVVEGMPALPEAPGLAIHGRLVDLAGEEAAGATVVATSPALVGEQVVISDETGYFKIVGLPAGVYTVTIYYDNNTYSDTDVAVTEGEAAVVEKVLDPGELPPRPPVIDIGGDVQTVTVDEPDEVAAVSDP